MKHKQTLIWAVIITAAAILLGLFFWDFSSHVNEILAGEGYADSIANQCISLCLKILLVLVCMVVCNAVMLEKGLRLSARTTVSSTLLPLIFQAAFSNAPTTNS